MISISRSCGPERRGFWQEVFCLSGSVTPYVKGRVFVAGLWAAVVVTFFYFTGTTGGFGVAPYELIGFVLALLLVLRTNSGYDRWYEGRKLWGGIVNQSRNLRVITLAYGPRDPQWRDAAARWIAAFSHLSRHSLRGERDISDLSGLLTPAEIEKLKQAEHMPLWASLQIGRLLQDAVDREELDGFAFMRAEEQRAMLVDHLGACERIKKTPLAKVVSIKIRRFLFLYLTILPVAIADRCGGLTILLTMLVAYPLLSLDQIGIELENPFSQDRLSHLPLEEIGETIQRNVLHLDQPGTTATVEPYRAPARMNGYAHPQPRAVG